MRRIWVPVVVAMCLSACGWTQFRGDASHTGNQPFESQVSAANAATLVELWAGTTSGSIVSSAALAGGDVYVGADDSLVAFDAAGTTGCSGTPKSCAPLWTGTTAGTVTSSPAVANAVVYIGSGDDNLYAFDATGATGCSGAPKTCAPLWSGATGGAVSSSPTVVNGIVYVGSSDGALHAFDAAGTTGCSGTPRVCAPLWTAATGGPVTSSPAVANGVVYVGSADGKVYALDAAGATGCSGSPKVCLPLWTATTGGGVTASPAVLDGQVYVGSADAKLHVFGLAPPSPTTTALGANPNPSTLGDPVTFTATVTSSGGTPAGTVTFRDGSTVLGTSTLAGGQTTLTTSSLTVGQHPITAAYSGAPTFASSTSGTVTQTVNPASSPPMVVSVGYYDTHHTHVLQTKPSPWQGSAGVVFVGIPDSSSGGWDTAGVRIDNQTGSTISGVVVNVDIGSHSYALWGTNSIPAHSSLILAQTGYENFDGSDHHAAGCYGCDPSLCTTAVDHSVPIVHVKIGGTTTDYRDTGLFLSTGGVDRAGCPYTGTRNDESEQWQVITT